MEQGGVSCSEWVLTTAFPLLSAVLRLGTASEPDPDGLMGKPQMRDTGSNPVRGLWRKPYIS